MKINVIKSVAVRYKAEFEDAPVGIGDSGHPFKPYELSVSTYEGRSPTKVVLRGWAIRADGSPGSIHREKTYYKPSETPQWVLEILRSDGFDPIVRLWSHGLK